MQIPTYKNLSLKEVMGLTCLQEPRRGIGAELAPSEYLASIIFNKKQIIWNKSPQRTPL